MLSSLAISWIPIESLHPRVTCEDGVGQLRYQVTTLVEQEAPVRGEVVREYISAIVYAQHVRNVSKQDYLAAPALSQ